MEILGGIFIELSLREIENEKDDILTLLYSLNNIDKNGKYLNHLSSAWCVILFFQVNCISDSIQDPKSLKLL